MRLQAFSFGLLILEEVNSHVKRTLNQPRGKIHVLRPLFLPKPTKEPRLLVNSHIRSGSSTWKLKLRLRITRALVDSLTAIS